MGSIFGKIARGVGKAVMTVARSPGVKMVPGLGTAATVLTGASALGLLGGGGGGGGNMPALPGLPGMPNMPSVAGDRSIFRNDPNTIAAIKPYAISKANLKEYHRAPKGFVIVFDEKGDPMGVPKALAKLFFGWKPAKKPLLSIRDTNAIRHAGRAIKKLQNAERMAKRIANWKSPTRSKQIFVTGGVVGKKKAA